jgi:hypothetical protein
LFMLASGSFGAAAFLNDGFLALQGFDKLLHTWSWLIQSTLFNRW